jgi:hypothetical protein
VFPSVFSDLTIDMLITHTTFCGLTRARVYVCVFVCVRVCVCVCVCGLCRYFVLPFTIAALHSPAFATATSSPGLPPPLVLNTLINAATLYLFVARYVFALRVHLS